MVDVLRSQFAETFNDDDREPIVAFGIPYVDGEFSLYAPSAGPWKLLGLLSVIVTTLSIILACFIYKVIVERRGTIGSFLSGWGFVIPMSLYLPFYLLDALDLSNKILCLSTATLSCVCFRCIEAMYGTSPDVVESSIWNYCLYYSSPVPFVWNAKTGDRQKITRTAFVCSLMERLLNFMALSLVLSVMDHFDYKPFEDRVELARLHISHHLFSLGHLYNSYCITILLYLTLNNLFEINAFQEKAKGLATKKIFNSPLTKSKTPTEFWTKRWNHMTHLQLKNGIFEPTKKCFKDQKAAMFLTFMMSGLYHEYCWACMFYNQSHLYSPDGTCLKDKSCYHVQFGRVTAFFAYIGIVMLLERPLSKYALFKWLSSVLPTLAIAQLLVLVHLPFVKWYGGDWIEGGSFDDLSVMTFMVRKV
mmetsp:Transcript_7014/g.14939  ORF Transcript_7014/g.14939 Transcript_7014/m.14939 type:complete len:418 (-) Transcript_7014:328-1581(-)